MGMMEHDILKVLYTEEEIKARVHDLGARMYEDLKDKDPLFVSVLRGAFIFMADIVRACQVKCDVEFIAVSSYGNATSSSGAVQITHDIQQDISGRDLVVIEDILDSGNTLNFLKQYFLTKGAASVSICTLLDKPSRRTKAITADYVGFVVPDEFVVGYGLDYCQKYRNLPYIGVLKPEVYSGSINDASADALLKGEMFLLVLVETWFLKCNLGSIRRRIGYLKVLRRGDPMGGVPPLCRCGWGIFKGEGESKHPPP